MDIKVYDKCILKKTKGGEMGKRIEREKMTIQRMIALYQRRCPEAQADNAHYQPSAGRQAPGAAAAGKISTEKVAAFPGQRCAAGRQVVLL